MRVAGALALLLCSFAFGQTAGDPEVARAKAEIERLRELVAAGAAPRVQLQRAEEAMADVEDAAFLRRTLYGPELTEAQADEMVFAATRRYDRRKDAYDRARKLVDAGGASAVSLGTFLEEMDMAGKERGLAETRAGLTREIARMARDEEALMARLAQAPEEAHAIAERYDGDGVFTTATFARVEAAFEQHFGKTLPVSANGETAVHKAMGFDHRGRVDVAIHPDAPEGAWLRQYLTENHIPFFAFRQAVPGKATGAHIHMGPISGHLATGG